MMQCIRCNKEIQIGEKVVEFVEAIVVNDDCTELDDDAEVCRFCPECFEVVCKQAPEVR